MQEKLQEIKEEAFKKDAENRKFFKQLKKKPPKKLDLIMQDLHDEVFAYTDCLSCANCCKTTGPLFTDKDITRISKHFRMKEPAFIDTYLRVDEDGDHVLKEVPCAFLGADNYCSIYDVRPKACREFPHLDRRKFEQIGNITRKNTAVCPAAYDAVELLKKKVKG